MLHKGHYLVCGMTRSGKGQLMRGLIERYRSAGMPVLYWTPKLPEYLGIKDMVDYCVLKEAQQFYDLCCKVIKEMPCVIIIDEAGAFKRTHENELVEMLNQWAAYGVEIYLQVQRAKMVTPNIRDACENCISFKQMGRENAEFLAEQYGPEFRHVSADDFPKGVFIARENYHDAVTYGRSWEVDGAGKFRRV